MADVTIGQSAPTRDNDLIAQLELAVQDDARRRLDRARAEEEARKRKNDEVRKRVFQKIAQESQLLMAAQFIPYQPTSTASTNTTTKFQVTPADDQPTTSAGHTHASPLSPSTPPPTAPLGATEVGPTPSHPVGELRLFASVQIPMVEVLQSRDDLSDTDLITKYAPRVLEQLLDQIERFRSSNELDPVTPAEATHRPGQADPFTTREQA